MRLVSFLGTGDYTRVRYCWAEQGEHECEYVAEALAALARPSEVRLLATEEARRSHGERIRRRIEALEIPVVIESLADGRDVQEQWQQYELVREQLSAPDADEVLLDITHGFRAQPFLAGAALAVRRALDPEAQAVRIVYGERDGSAGRIWNLDLFVDLLDWALALGLFVRTGVAAPLVALARRERHRQGQAARGNGDFPRFSSLIDAIDAFASDLALVRVASLVTGYEQDDTRKTSARSTARALAQAIEDHRAEIEHRLPPLAPMLERLRDVAGSLAARTLSSDEGWQAQLALARHYVSLERYPEAAIVTREAAVSVHARDAGAVEVNSPQFSDVKRREADRLFSTEDPRARDVAAVRNDIGHGGFRRQPLSAARLRERVVRMVDELESAPAAGPPARRPPRTLFVSRHSGAEEWARDANLAVGAVVTHLRMDEVAAGDTVIGSLPVNLAGEVCARGARYLHLVIDLPPERRGQELSADDLRALGARLMEFEVKKSPD